MEVVSLIHADPPHADRWPACCCFRLLLRDLQPHIFAVEQFEFLSPGCQDKVVVQNLVGQVVTIFARVTMLGTPNVGFEFGVLVTFLYAAISLFQHRIFFELVSEGYI